MGRYRSAAKMAAQQTEVAGKAAGAETGSAMREKRDIAWQNKDITAKLLGENLKDKSFAVYGVKVPKVVDVLPTNLPAVEANELRIDNIFLLEDGSLAIVDYESDYKETDKVKYLNYVIRTFRKYGIDRRSRMIVVYMADIEPEETRAELDVGCLRFTVDAAFLTELDSEGIMGRLEARIRKGEALTAEEQMQLLILPLTYKGTEAKRESIRRCFELAKEIEDEQVQSFVMAGMLVFADKVVTKEDSRNIKRWIMMTKVGQLFEEEKMKAVEEARREERQAAKEAVEKERQNTAKALLAKGFSVDDILGIIQPLTKEEVELLFRQ